MANLGVYIDIDLGPAMTKTTPVVTTTTSCPLI